MGLPETLNFHEFEMLPVRAFDPIDLSSMSMNVLYILAICLTGNNGFGVFFFFETHSWVLHARIGMCVWCSRAGLFRICAICMNQRQRVSSFGLKDRVIYSHGYLHFFTSNLFIFYSDFSEENVMYTFFLMLFEFFVFLHAHAAE